MSLDVKIKQALIIVGYVVLTAKKVIIHSSVFNKNWMHKIFVCV